MSVIVNISHNNIVYASEDNIENVHVGIYHIVRKVMPSCNSSADQNTLRSMMIVVTLSLALFSSSLILHCECSSTRMFTFRTTPDGMQPITRTCVYIFNLFTFLIFFIAVYISFLLSFLPDWRINVFKYRYRKTSDRSQAPHTVYMPEV